jgi:hypothetical protein
VKSVCKLFHDILIQSCVFFSCLFNASVVARQTPDPDFLALKEEVAELKTTIQQAQQQQPQHKSALPAPNPLESSFPPDFAKTMMDAISILRAEIAELRNLQQPTSTPSPARRKVCSNVLTSELHLSEASLAVKEDDDASMDHVS